MAKTHYKTSIFCSPAYEILCVLRPSFGKVIPPSFFELGLLELVQIYNELSDIGKPPPVIDAEELQKDPEVFELFRHA
ncbi:hypothetical protein P8452_03908 [Trifolium repens]|nr:hypothetical protein P8452_03908 [Trifolium repens]